jgi:hypothetical protein
MEGRRPKRGTNGWHGQFRGKRKRKALEGAKNNRIHE